jgi:hypothetical protein
MGYKIESFDLAKSKGLIKSFDQIKFDLPTMIQEQILNLILSNIKNKTKKYSNTK